MKRFFSIIIFSVALLFPWRSFAAVMTVAPSPVDPDVIVISLDTQGDHVNAVQGHFTFDTNAFFINDLSDAGSIVNFWVDQPSFSNTSGTVDFAGVIPGGGMTADGIIATITILPTGAVATSDFAVVSAQTLLNDGEGTPANVSVVSHPFPLVVGNIPLVGAGTQAPDPFTPEVGMDPSMFNGQYFVAFATTDHGSGIDHYQVLEVPAGGKVSSSSEWNTASSPYVLRDQTLSSDIYVRAVDKAGNFWIAKVSAKNKPIKISNPWWDLGISSAAIVLLLIMIGTVYRRRTWKRNQSGQYF